MPWPRGLAGRYGAPRWFIKTIIGISKDEIVLDRKQTPRAGFVTASALEVLGGGAFLPLGHKLGIGTGDDGLSGTTHEVEQVEHVVH